MSKYEITPAICKAYLDNPGVSPFSGRKISPTGSLARKLERYCKNEFTKEDCAKWHSNPSRNPKTGHKISTTSKTGLYQQLLEICGSLKNNTDRDKLIVAMKKAINPLMVKGDFAKTRIKMKSIITSYIEGIKPCLHQGENNKQYLVGKDKKPLVYLTQRIGSDSNAGEAYLNMGKGFARLLKFACKVVDRDSESEREVVILLKMSKLVEEGKTPNMPITYKAMKCFESGGPFYGPREYYVIINELAECDLQTLYRTRLNIATHESIVMQIIFATYFFHQQGYRHRDLHLGNFLVHSINPGGYWRYKVGDDVIYVPNTGYQLVMWDFGSAKKYSEDRYKKDYWLPLSLIKEMATMYTQKYQMISPPDSFIECLTPLVQHFKVFSIDSEQKILSAFVSKIASKEFAFKHISINPPTPPGHLLNVKAYTL